MSREMFVWNECTCIHGNIYMVKKKLLQLAEVSNCHIARFGTILSAHHQNLRLLTVSGNLCYNWRHCTSQTVQIKPARHSSSAGQIMSFKHVGRFVFFVFLEIKKEKRPWNCWNDLVAFSQFLLMTKVISKCHHESHVGMKVFRLLQRPCMYFVELNLHSRDARQSCMHEYTQPTKLKSVCKNGRWDMIH